MAPSKKLSKEELEKQFQFWFTFDKRYRYLRPLGSGSYGMVAASLDNISGNEVAIKRIRTGNDFILTRRALRELRLLRHFSGHPNIIPIISVLRPENRDFEGIYMIQELMDTDLFHVIQSDQPLSEQHVQYFTFQLLRGLSAIHDANVIHRDLKPGNLFVKANCELKIGDFGLARGIAEPNVGSSDEFMTEYVATRWYRAPEIMLSRAGYDKPIDIWSVGCIMAELYNRKPLFPGSSHQQQMLLILQKLGTPSEDVFAHIPSLISKSFLRNLPRYPKQPLPKIVPKASPLALDLIEKMLEFNPIKRISAAEALKHPYFDSLKNLTGIEIPRIGPFDFSFDYVSEERRNNSYEERKILQELKEKIYNEANYYIKNESSNVADILAGISLDKSNSKKDGLSRSSSSSSDKSVSSEKLNKDAKRGSKGSLLGII